MRTAAIGLMMSAFVLAAAAANAAPSVPAATSGQQNIIAVAGGCGGGFHPNRWGRCVPNRDGYDRAYRRGGFYGGGDGMEPWNRPSPTDHIANELNRRELRGGY